MRECSNAVACGCIENAKDVSTCLMNQTSQLSTNLEHLVHDVVETIHEESEPDLQGIVDFILNGSGEDAGGVRGLVQMVPDMSMAIVNNASECATVVLR